jgi:TetR/AcrR family transcriptional regulator
MSEDIHDDAPQADRPPARKRPRPGERRLQILQTLANMLEQPGGERVTTSALAARIGVSEAALYRHFASKAQMFEGLIEFVEQSCMGLIRQVTGHRPRSARPEPVGAHRFAAAAVRRKEPRHVPRHDGRRPDF